MPIFKMTVAHTIYGQFDDADEAIRHFRSADLGALLEECDDGDLICGTHRGAIDEIPAEKVQDELLAIGNDGSFFEELAVEQADSRTGPRIIAKFNPQAWVNDYAVDVDPEGDTKWDVTDFLTKEYTREQLAGLEDNSYETDDLTRERNAPKWVRNWNGPFYVEVASSIEDYLIDTDDGDDDGDDDDSDDE